MRTLFENAVGVAPPSTVDVDRLIARRRRIQWLRWVGRVGLALVAIAALGGVTAYFRTDDGPAPAAPVNPADETVDQRAARYAAELPAILAERLPGITATGPFTFAYLTREVGLVARGKPAPPPEIAYTWTGTVTGPAGGAELSVSVSSRLRGVAGEVRDHIERQECRQDCEVTTGPNGERIQRRGTAEVTAVLPDLTWVSVSCPVLTLDQLQAVATDGRLAW